MLSKRFCLASLLVILLSASASADTVTLTSGSIIKRCNPREKSIGVVGADFRLSYFASPDAGTPCSSLPHNVTFAFPSGVENSNGFAIYRGTAYSIFSGVFTVGESSVSGFIDLFLMLGGDALRVDLIGSGVGTGGPNLVNFDVSAPTAVPEPATILLLSVGLAGAAFRYRPRH
ncbi:MAG: PEP-CTERM sorting domain-containing protein [Acidobacteriota bacterium]